MSFHTSTGTVSQVWPSTLKTYINMTHVTEFWVVYILWDMKNLQWQNALGFCQEVSRNSFCIDTTDYQKTSLSHFDPLGILLCIFQLSHCHNTYIPKYVCMYIHTYMYCVYIHTHTHMFACMYVHTYIHTYICTYTHTYICSYILLFISLS